jgi:hypothetical protein
VAVALWKESYHNTIVSELTKKSKASSDRPTVVSSAMELVIAVITAAILLVAIVMTRNYPTTLEEPVMERGRAKGKMALGKRDYGTSDVTTVAQQETVRE